MNDTTAAGVTATSTTFLASCCQNPLLRSLLSLVIALASYFGTSLLLLLAMILSVAFIGAQNGQSSALRLLRTILVFIVVMALCVLAIYGWRRLGHTCQWFGFGGTDHPCRDRRWPFKNCIEFFYAITAAVAIAHVFVITVGSAMILVMMSDNAGDRPDQVNGNVVVIVWISGVLTVVTMFVIGARQTGLFGIFPLKDELLVMTQGEDQELTYSIV